MSATGLAAAAVRAPFTGRARRELLFCLLGVPFIVFLPLAGFFATALLAAHAHGTPWAGRGNPSALAIAAAAAVAVLLTVLLVTTGAARGLAAAPRWLAGRLLGCQVVAPPPPRQARGVLATLEARLRDGPGWRAVAYLLLKVPVALLGGYAAGVFWAAGLVNLTFPFWWLEFRNHPASVRLSPVPVVTPFDWIGQGHFQVTTFPGTFAAFAAGAGMLLTAPWATRAVAVADGWLIQRLLGPGPLAQRLRDLERTRALAVDDAAARLRRLERDLHDGAQIRLATLAMNLGMAKKKLGDHGDVTDAEAARELVSAALQGAKDALGELRELARGIHPPVLDNGLADALATLAASNAIPAELTVSVPVRPTPAIETIAYFCAAELLANAAKHSQANKIKIDVTERAGVLVVRIADDGRGGADPAAGSGLSGLRQRVAVVDGSLDIVSPPGGPTQVTVELPLRA
ncbi:MAG: sensor domain-containing protein [Streptosporangiaceae bacterium]|nr:sensor domain-containing protein [Streptosporangiaceae bacterium]MBV9854932.1 sensor domain-containing protein [Streptosporangiaceae bacterium]